MSIYGSRLSAHELTLGPPGYAELRCSVMPAAMEIELTDGDFCAHGDKSSGSKKADYILND
jgi:hypothetical protein